MSTVPDHGLKEMVPVFGPDALGAQAGVSFHHALARLSEGGDLKARLLLSALSHFAAKGYDGVQVKEVSVSKDRDGVHREETGRVLRGHARELPDKTENR